MRHKQQRDPLVDEELLHPLDRVDIEMVGGLVEQQHIGRVHERTRQQGLTGTTATGLLDARLGVEPQMLQRRLHAEMQLPRIGRIHLSMQAIEFLQRLLGMIGGHAYRRRMVARQQCSRLTQPGRHDVEHRTSERARHILFEARDGHATLPHHEAAVGEQRAVEHLHEGALSGAVAPQHAHPFAPLDGEGGAIEHRRAAECHAHLLQGHQCHQRTPSSVTGTLSRPTRSTMETTTRDGARRDESLTTSCVNDDGRTR